MSERPRKAPRQDPPNAGEEEPPRRHARFWLGFLVFVLTFYFVLVTAPAPGLAWDEAIYIGYGLDFLRWQQAPDRWDVRRHWQAPYVRRTDVAVALGHEAPSDGGRFIRLTEPLARELGADRLRAMRIYGGPWEDHPPLGKALIAGAIRVLSRATDLILAARAAPAFCFAAVALLLYLFVSAHFGVAAGALAAPALVLMPRLFGHAHFATLEMPLLLTWALTVVAFEKGTRNALWSVAAGLCFGLALLTRFNAVFLPAFLVPWGVVFRPKRVWTNLLAMGVLSPLVFLAGWPAMWRGTFCAVQVYVDNKFHRMVIPFSFFGVDHPGPTYPFLMALLATPLPILAAALIGAVVALRPNGDAVRREAAWLMVAAFLVPLSLAALPNVPKYDGVRLFMPAFPFLAGLAGVGAAAGWRRAAASTSPRRWALVGLVVLVLLVAPIALLYPWHLAYYNILCGGPWGADRLGMETIYWNESFNDEVLAYIEEQLPHGGKVALAAIGSEVDDIYKLTGRWPEGVTVTDFARGDWDLLVVVPRKGWLRQLDPAVWEHRKARRLARRPPDRVWTLTPFDSVPICEAYLRNGPT